MTASRRSTNRIIFTAALIFVTLMGSFFMAFQNVAYGAGGSLRVYTGLTGVNVYVDGVLSGSTDSYSGLTISGLNAGTYPLKLIMSGYKDWTKQVTITVGQTSTVYAYLEEGTGVSTTRTETISYNSASSSLRVYSGINNVKVYVGGEYGGSTDSYSGATVNGLIVGTYSLKLSLSGYKDWTKQVSIVAGQTTIVYAYLESGTGASVTRNETVSYNSALGSLKVYTGLTGVSVYATDEYGGKTDSYSGATVNGLIVGTYSLKLALSGYKDWTKQVTITVGKTTTIYAYLEDGIGTSVTRSETVAYDSPYGNLKVYTGLDGVSVYMGAEYGGKTDSYSGATVNGLIATTYSLKLSLPDHKDWTKQITITVGKTTTVYAYLEPGTGVSPTRSETLSYDSALGTLKVNTGVTGVNVFVGAEYGGLTGYSGATVNGLLTGTYTLKLTSDNYYEWTQQVTITPAQTTTIQATLTPTSTSTPTLEPQTTTPTPTSTPLADYMVTVSAGAGGTIDPHGSLFSTPGTSYTFTITPNSKYRILGVFDNGVSKGAISTYYLANIHENHVIQANFSRISIQTSTPTNTQITNSPSSELLNTLALYLVIGVIGFFLLAGAAYFRANRRRLLTININGQGTTKPLPNIQKYKKGTQATIEAVPDSGWEFDKWSGEASGRRNPIILTMDSHCVITASFIPAEGKRQVFISHSEEDGDIASAIAKNLENNGYRAWYYERDSVPGQSYILKTSQAIEQSQAVILIISPYSLGSNQVHTEVITAHEAGKFFIPVLNSVTHVEFQNRRPEWRRVMAAAASIAIPKQGVSEIMPRIIKGLAELGVKKKDDV